MFEWFLFSHEPFVEQPAQHSPRKVLFPSVVWWTVGNSTCSRCTWCLIEVSCSFKTIVGSPCSYDRRDFTICPFHRSELGIGWRKSSSTCKVPHEIAYHSKGKTSKGYIDVGREISNVIFQKTGILVPVGSGLTLWNSFTSPCKIRY